MTRTEERLRDALHASADRVHDDRLRPLPSLEPQAERKARRRQTWRAWLIPAAAAAGVALVASLAVAVAGGPRPAAGDHGPTSTGRPNPTGTGHPPRYFAGIPASRDVGADVGIYSTSDGLLVAKAVTPSVPGWSLKPDAVAATPDDRTFYVDYDATSSTGSQVWVYSFSVTAGGSYTQGTKVKGGVLSGLAGLGGAASMAVSPDGTELALTADTTTDLSYYTEGVADEIVVIDLRTGQRTVWQGGLYRSGKVFSIPNLSWTADGQSLVYLALWCNLPAGNPCTGASGSDGYRDTQVRSLRVAAGGGPLDSGHVLLSQSARFPVIVQALAGPDGSDLSVLVLYGHVNAAGVWPRVAVEHVSAVNGSLLGVDYHAITQPNGGEPDFTWLSTDPSGRYVIYNYAAPLAYVTGWIDRGGLNPLPIGATTVGPLVIAW